MLLFCDVGGQTWMFWRIGWFGETCGHHPCFVGLFSCRS